MATIDKVDRKIIDLLMQDGRMQAAEIARRLGDVTERVVRYRIENLVEKEIIRISAIVNPKKLGMEVVADVWLEVDAGAVLDVAHKLASYASVSYVACSIGETDLSLQVQARDTTEVYRFVTEVIGRVPGVRKTRTSIVPLVIKDVFEWQVPSDAGEDETQAPV
jgi:Lrp/AsnC family transcriptional regulator for asnA, asnC and gidA